jgi:maleylacetate reductase
VALGATGTALHHKTCHVLGGMYNLNHGDMNSVILPHAVAFNTPAVPAIMERVRVALGAPDGVSAAAALFDLAASIKAPSTLAEIGMTSDDLEPAVPYIVADTNAAQGANPLVVDAAGVRAMLQAAYNGTRPI